MCVRESGILRLSQTHYYVSTAQKHFKSEGPSTKCFTDISNCNFSNSKFVEGEFSKHTASLQNGEHFLSIEHLCWGDKRRQNQVNTFNRRLTKTADLIYSEHTTERDWMSVSIRARVRVYIYLSICISHSMCKQKNAHYCFVYSLLCSTKHCVLFHQIYEWAVLVETVAYAFEDRISDWQSIGSKDLRRSLTMWVTARIQLKFILSLSHTRRTLFVSYKSFFFVHAYVRFFGLSFYLLLLLVFLVTVFIAFEYKYLSQGNLQLNWTNVNNEKKR